MLGLTRTKTTAVAPAPRRPEPERQCTGTTRRTGAQCTQWGSRAGQRCHLHPETPPPPAARHEPPPAALTASVAQFQLDGVAWQTWKFGSRAWQDEAWRLYDITGQLRFVANWIGNSVSRCRLYVADVDDAGEAGEETTDLQVAQLASGPLGAGPSKDEALRLLGTNLFICGEAYIIAEADALADGEDRWFVVSGRQIRRQGGEIRIRRSQIDGGGDMIYREGVDLILRVWTPHPADTDEPDSPTRSAIPDLRELEAIRKRKFAELDSRLAGAGLLPLPEGIDFPRAPNDPPGVEGFMQLLTRTMATSLDDRGSAESMVPIMFTVPGEYLDKIRQVTFWSELSKELLPMGEAAIRALGQDLDIPAEILTGQAESNHWCTVRDVEIMAHDGWKTYDQLVAGEEVLTLNHETGLSEWQPLLAINTWQVVDEPMVSIKGRGHSSLTTARHRWPTLSGGRWKTPQRAWDTSAGLVERARAATNPNAQMHDYILLAAPSADLPTEAKYSDALVEMVAWYFTEGSLGVRPGRNTPQVTIYQSHQINPDNCARIGRALTTLFGPASDTFDKGGRYASPESIARRAEAHRLRAADPRISLLEIGRRLGVSGVMAGKYLRADARLRDEVPRWRQVIKAGGEMTLFLLNAAAAEVLLEHAPARVVTLDFIRQLTAAQLELFIDTAVRGDGHIQGTTIHLGQKDPRMCDAFELAAILSGRYVNRYEVIGMGRSADGPRQKTQHVVSVGSRTTFAPRGRSFTEQPYTGVIWCPTTANGTWLARHDGTVFYTGNSAWQISEDAIKTQIVPVLNRIAAAITTGYLKGALAELGDDPAKHVYAFDTSPLTADPDRTDDAIRYHGAGLLADKAAIEAGNFSEEDLPDDDERIRRLVEKAIASNPALLADPTLRKIVGIEAPPPEPEPAPGPAPAEPPAADPPVDDKDKPAEASVFTVANLAIRHALSLAGGRLVPHTQRDRYPGTARHQLHCRHGAVSREQADRVLRGAWDDLPAVAEDLHLDADQLRTLLHDFAAELLTHGLEYEPRLLRDWVGAAVRSRTLYAMGMAA